MDIQFWGVRGSLPTPLSPLQFRSKISAIIQRITPKDIESTESREQFIQNLPEYLGSTTGGNTACVEVRNKNGTLFILDAGSGIRVLGKEASCKKAGVYHIFLSHFHWDHICGLPFFDPLFNPNSEIHFYSMSADCEKYLTTQMESPYFPVPLKSGTKNMHFHQVSDGETLEIDGTVISCKKMSHPGGVLCWSFSEDGRKFVYASDVELSPEDNRWPGNEDTFFLNADAVVLDAQYTEVEAIQKANWGHSPFARDVDFARSWNIHNVFLFHHEPMYHDKKLDQLVQAARYYLQYSGETAVNVFVAAENKAFHL